MNVSNYLSSPRWNICFVNEIDSERTQRIFGFIRAKWMTLIGRRGCSRFDWISVVPRPYLNRNRESVSRVLLLTHAALYPQVTKNQSKFQASRMSAVFMILWLNSKYLIKSEFCNTFICKQSKLCLRHIVWITISSFVAMVLDKKEQSFHLTRRLLASISNLERNILIPIIMHWISWRVLNKHFLPVYHHKVCTPCFWWE